MKCDRAEKLLSASLDGELDAQDLLPLRDHLDRCPRCRAARMEWQSYGEHLKSAPLPITPGLKGAWNDIRQRMRQDEKPRRWKPAYPFPMYWVSAAALLVVTMGIFFLYPGDPAPTDSKIFAMAENVEFVETSIPGATPVVYMDDASGWTVVWIVEAEPPDEDSTG